MNLFPAVDPIPLPAPVWLFRVLHLVTLALHFVAVEMLLGGLLVATGLSFLGGRKRLAEAGGLRRGAAAVMARRLPLVMTYVINLGVPPLLFAQVLYGRALYTSSVLIGVYWISVIFLLMGCYWLLYRFAAATEAGRPAWVLGLSAWLLAGAIARIYSTNMTLMLRPEVWNQMYSASGIGLHLPPPDPTLLPRWLFMLSGGLLIAALWMVWLAGRKSVAAEVRSYLSATGGRLGLVAGVGLGPMAFWVFRTQPAAVREGLTNTPLYLMAGCLWLAATLIILGMCLAWARKKARSPLASWSAALLALVLMSSWTVFRDGIRDLTLAAKGLNVWEREVVTNWSVVGLFLVLFLAGLGGLAWLMSVMARAKPVSEGAV